MKITEETWPAWAKIIADPFEPNEYAPSAVERLMECLEPFIGRTRGIRSQFHAKNQIILIKFTTKEGKEFYDLAVERYKERIAKAEAREGLTKRQISVIKLVAFGQYKIAAESNIDRVTYLCENMHNSVQNGYAAVCALSYKSGITKCVKHLIEKYGVKRDEISLIWGGGKTKATKKQQTKASITSDDLIMAAFEKAGIKMEDIGLEDVEDLVDEAEEDPSFRLGIQSRKERQIEIDKFLSGKSLYCFFTFRAGGVGLDLHHTDDQTKEKVRHKESGYAYLEDIPKIPTRPRKTFIAPTWSPEEMVQGSGRAARLNSLSDTEQYMVFFQGTVEERVAHIVGKGLKCLSKVVKHRGEAWESLIVGGLEEEEKIIKNLESNNIDVPEDGEELDTGFEEDEEDGDK